MARDGLGGCGGGGGGGGGLSGASLVGALAVFVDVVWLEVAVFDASAC